MSNYPENVIIKACLLKTGFPINNLCVGTISHIIYARALKNLCGLKAKEIAKRLDCKRNEINSELLLRIDDDYGEEASIRTQLIMIEAKAHELIWSEHASIR